MVEMLEGSVAWQGIRFGVEADSVRSVNWPKDRLDYHAATLVSSGNFIRSRGGI